MIDPAGRLKKEYFLSDGLHLSENGYKLWKEIIRKHINW
jgi:lysophospholipase L1-like esterase